MNSTRSLLTTAALLAASAFAGAARAQNTQPPKEDAAKGKARYAEVGCYQCHGYVGQGGVGPRLAPNPLAYAAFLKYTREPKGQMPPYTSKYLTDQDMADIYAYLLTIPKPPDWKTLPELKD
jgi:ubiquinol-cytochrome c reductase cytochrome c subunit